MNATTTSTPPAPPPQAETEPGPLDARIAQAEQRLVEREARMRRGVGTLGARVRGSLRPWRLLLPALGVATAVGGLLWRRRPRRLAALQAPGAHAAKPAPALGGGSWIPLVGLVWPLLPDAWRARVHPKVAELMLVTGLPLLAKLWSPSRLPELTTSGPIDRSGLAGTWYELARSPASGQGAGPVRWRHTLRASGAIELRNEHAGPQGDRLTRSGEATPVAGSGGVRWRVSHWPAVWRWLPLAWHDEVVLHMDDAATELLLGSPGRGRLRLLARQPHLSPPRIEALLALAAQRGFDRQRLLFADGIASGGGA